VGVFSLAAALFFSKSHNRFSTASSVNFILPSHYIKQHTMSSFNIRLV
jgi:hypothetical protein